MKDNKGFKISQYACAVLLIVSSIVMVAYQVVHIDDVAGGLLYYVAQSFLLAGNARNICFSRNFFVIL
jgi:hypothetical protein